MLAGIAGLFEMAEFFLGSPRLAMMPNRVSKDDTDSGVHLQGKVVLYGEQRPSSPKGVYASLLPSLTRCPRSNEIPPYGSGENFLVTGLILLSLPTVAKGFVSQDAGPTLCVPLSAFWSLSCSLSVHGQRESGPSTRRTQLPSAGKSLVALSIGFRHICSVDDGSEMVSADNSVALLWRWHLTFLFCRPLGVLDDDANDVHGHTSRAKERPRVLVVRQMCL